jgi:aspartate aminotransferase
LSVGGGGEGGDFAVWSLEASKGERVVGRAAICSGKTCCHDFPVGLNGYPAAARVHERLDLLHTALTRLRDDGMPVDAIAPEGAMYMSANFALQGRVTPDRTRLDGDEAVRAYLLRAAGLAVVPLRAFGSDEDTGWFRLSVGAVSVGEIERVMPKLRGALEACVEGMRG